MARKYPGARFALLLLKLLGGVSIVAGLAVGVVVTLKMGWIGLAIGGGLVYSGVMNIALGELGDAVLDGSEASQAIAAQHRQTARAQPALTLPGQRRAP